MSKPVQKELFVAIFYFIASAVFFSLIFILGEWKKPEESLYYLDVFGSSFFFLRGWSTFKQWKKEKQNNKTSSE